MAENNNNAKVRILSMIALARKAGKIITGEDGCEKTIRENEECIVFISADASDNTKKKFINKTAYYKRPVFQIFTKEEIEQHTGLHNRAVMVLTDNNFASKIIEMIDALDNNL